MTPGPKVVRTREVSRPTTGGTSENDLLQSQSGTPNTLRSRRWQAKSHEGGIAYSSLSKQCTTSRASDFLAKIFALWPFQTALTIVLPSGSFYQVRRQRRFVSDHCSTSRSVLLRHRRRSSNDSEELPVRSCCLERKRNSLFQIFAQAVACFACDRPTVTAAAKASSARKEP